MRNRGKQKKYQKDCRLPGLPVRNKHHSKGDAAYSHGCSERKAHCSVELAQRLNKAAS